MTPKRSRISWLPSWRLVADSYPPIKFFERVAPPADWELLVDLAKRTDPSAEAVGDLALVPVEDRISGPGCGRVMPSFTFLDPNPPGSRFSNNIFGAYYAAYDLDTAIAETIYHRERFLHEGKITRTQDIDHIVILADITGNFHDIRGLQAKLPEIYHNTDYGASQAMALALKRAGSFGIVYSSLRNGAGQRIAVLRPSVLANIREDAVITCRWDGTKISGYYHKSYWVTI